MEQHGDARLVGDARKVALGRQDVLAHVIGREERARLVPHVVRDPDGAYAVHRHELPPDGDHLVADAPDDLGHELWVIGQHVAEGLVANDPHEPLARTARARQEAHALGEGACHALHGAVVDLLRAGPRIGLE